MSCAKELEDHIVRVAGWYVNHTIVGESPNQWLLQNTSTKRPRGTASGAYWAEVAVLSCGKVVIHGDTEPLMLDSYASRAPVLGMEPILFAPARFAEVIRHAAKSARPDSDEFLKMVKRVMPQAMWRPSIDRLREEVAEMIAAIDSDDYPGMYPAQRAGLAEILVDSRDSGDWMVPVFKKRVYEITGDPEVVPKGHVLSSGVIAAHAILRRLDALLDARARPSS